MIGKITEIDLVDGTVDIAGQSKDGSFFTKGFKYSFIEKFTTKDGKETNALSWMITKDGNPRHEIGDVVEYYYEKPEDGSDISILKSIKSTDTPTKTNKFNNPKSVGGGITNKQLSVILGACYLSAKGVNDWNEYKDNLVTMLGTIEKDVEKLLR